MAIDPRLAGFEHPLRDQIVEMSAYGSRSQPEPLCERGGA
jgi:hypothetical protein